MVRWHSLWRGIQSVLFYYLSCTPYLKFVNRRNRKKQGKRAEIEDAAARAQNPDQYRHPLPFDTNEHWAEEIRLGPGPPPNRLSKKQRAALSRLRPNETSSNTGHTPINDRSTSKIDLESGGGGEKLVAASTERGRWRERQRDDEPLWGCEEYSAAVIPSLRSGKAGEASSRFPPYESRANPSANYIIAINPPINELHPPAVSNPAMGNVSNMWMLQPPPAAMVMSGHDVPDNRSRSTTNSSASSKRFADHKLGRKLSERLMEEKRRRGNLLYPNDESRRIYQDLPSQSSLIEAKYFEGDSSFLSALSTDSIEGAPASTESARGGIFAQNSRYPQEQNTLKLETASQDFAFPSRSRLVPGHEPKNALDQDLSRDSMDDTDPFATPPRQGGPFKSPTKTRRKHQELLEIIDDGESPGWKPGTELPGGEYHRRYSVDF